jgi:toxin ParE1/3/4
VKYQVVVTDDAERDLEEIYTYIAEADSAQNAEYVLDGILAAAEDLATFPDRGSVPKELRGLGISEYRQVLFKPYRAIYRVVDRQVVIYLIADGRRDMQSLLSRRLLG